MDLHRGHRPLNHPHIQEGLFRRLPFMNQRQDRRPNSSIKMKYFNFKFYAFFSLLFYLILFSYRYKHNALNYQIYKDNFPKDLDFYESIFYLFNEDAHYFSDEKLHDTDLASFVDTPPQINSHNFMSIFHNILHNLSNIYPNYKEEVLETRHTPHKRKLWEYVADAIVYQYKKRQIWSIHSINRYLSKGQTFGKHTKTMLTKTRNLKSFLKLSLASLQRQQMSSVITFWDKLEARFYMGKLDKILYTFLRMMHTDYWVSLNAAYCCLIIIAKLVYKFTFGSLRSAEQIQVRTKIFDFIFNKMIFMFGLLNIDNLGDFTLWTTWFALTGFLHTTSHLLKSRLDYLVLSPRIPVGTKIKMASLLLALIVWANALTIGVIFSYVKFGMFAAPVYLFLLYECMMLQFNCYHILYNIIINVYDSWHTGCWESKNLYLYYGDLVFGISVLIIDLFYHVHMLLWGSLILSMASLFLFMELKWIFNELRTKVMKHQNYLKILKQIDSKYPMASNEDLQRYNSHCSICWDPMKRARKLPCDHLFHDTCLRSWLEHDLSCPICRRSLGPNATTNSRNQTQSTNLDNTNVNTNNVNTNRFFMPFGFHRQQTNNNNANINSRNNNNSFMFRTIFYTTTHSPSPSSSVPSLSTQQQQTPNNANTSNLANMNLRIRFSRNQPNDLNSPQTQQAEQSNIAVPNTPLQQPINSRIATFTYRIGNLLGSNTLNTATRVNPFANNQNEPIIPINGQGINYDAHLNRPIQTPPNDIGNNNIAFEEDVVNTLTTDTHIINHDNININNNITNNSNNNNRSFNNFFFYFIDTILGWLNTACQRLIFFLLDSLFNLSASLSNNVTINAIPPITSNTQNNATALETDQTTPDGLDTNLSPTTLNTEIQNGATMPIGALPVTTTSSPQIRRVNQFFHFDASRYISWLPSISLHVSHLRISQPNTPLTQNPTNTANTINNSASNNITNSTHQPPIINETLNSTSSNSLSSVTSYIMDNMVRQVSDIFPNIPLSRIRHDLTVTWSVDRTIENILEGPLSTIIPGFDIEDESNNDNDVASNNINNNNNQLHNLAGGDSNNTQTLRRRRKRTNAENLVNDPNIVSNLNTTTLINTHKPSLSFLNTINPNINVRNVNYSHNNINNSHDESTILGDIESSDENSMEESLTEDEDGANPTINGNVFKNYDTSNQITKDCPTRATKSVEKDNVQSKNPFSTINVKEGFSHYFGDKIMNKKDDFSNDNQSNSNSSLPNTVSQPNNNADNIASTSKAKIPFIVNENHPVTRENSPFITYKGRFDSNSEMRETLLTLRKREMLQRARKFLAANQGDLNH